MIAFTTTFPRNSSRTSTHAVIVPSTALRTETPSEAPSVSFERGDCFRARHRVPERLRPLARRLPHERGQREADEDHQEGRDEAEGQGRAGPVPRDPRNARPADGDVRQPVLPPTSRWKRAMMLLLGSKNRFCTLSQPPSPSWSMVKSPVRTGNFFRFAFSTLSTTGR